MKAEYINPFIQSITEVFENMLECTPEMGDARVAENESQSTDLVGIIGLSGTAKATVAVRLPVPTALALVSKLLGTKMKCVDSLLVDGVGELANIVAGNAKSKFADQSLSLSLPTVVRGSILKSSNTKDCEWLEVPFTSPLGDFSLAISFKPLSVAEREATHESTSC
jgi:chemotaxis protein CheX